MASLRFDRGGFHHFSQETRTQIAELKQHELDDCFSNELALNQSPNSLFCILSDEHKIIAFIESEVQENRAQLQSIIVAGKQRRVGLGSRLLKYYLNIINDMGVQQINLQAPRNKQLFFTRFGFVTLNESSYDQRCHMLQPSVSYYLANGQDNSEAELEDQNQTMQLGKDSKQYLFSNEEQFSDLHRIMLNQARKRIWILAPDINCPVLNNEDSSQAIYRLIKRNPEAEVKILLTNDKNGAGYFNPCINIAQRLSSYVEIRQCQKSGSRIKESLTLVDYGANIFRKHMNSFSGAACFHNRLMFERLRSNFDQHWQFASPSMQLRRLVI